MKKSFYIPGLDGVRALAILLVFNDHTIGFRGLKGYFGVTLFFFLSGYLITTLLVRERQDTGAVHLRHFYWRRVLRIMPPMYLALVLSLIASRYGVGDPVTTAHGAANFLQSTNYAMAFTGDQNFLPGMVPLWSLAVEEHFYLAFPLLLVFLLPRFPPEKIAKGLLVACGLFLAWRAYLSFGQGWWYLRTYTATDTRADSILFGCVLALWANPLAEGQTVRKLASPWIVGVCVAAIVASFALPEGPVRQTFGYTVQGLALVPVFCAVVLHSRTGYMRFLEWKPLAWLGRVSYSFYLVHWLVFLTVVRIFGLEKPYLLPIGPTKIGLAVIALVASIGVAAGIFYTIERPLARLRRKAAVAPAIPARLLQHRRPA